MQVVFFLNVGESAFSSGFWGDNKRLLFFIVWMVVVNIVGFLMILANRRRMKNKRFGVSRRMFAVNVLLGGAVGQVLGMTLLRHTPEGSLSLLVILMLMAVQIGALVYFTSAEGQRKLREWSPERAREDWNETVRDAKSFFHTIDSDTREGMTR